MSVYWSRGDEDHYTVEQDPSNGVEPQPDLEKYEVALQPECAFRMVSIKLQVLMSPILCSNESTVNSIIRSVCFLNNFMRKREGNVYQQQLPDVDTDITD
jgi:hypothetical protein